MSWHWQHLFVLCLKKKIDFEVGYKSHTFYLRTCHYVVRTPRTFATSYPGHCIPLQGILPAFLAQIKLGVLFTVSVLWLCKQWLWIAIKQKWRYYLESTQVSHLFSLVAIIITIHLTDSNRQTTEEAIWTIIVRRFTIHYICPIFTTLKLNKIMPDILRTWI